MEKIIIECTLRKTVLYGYAPNVKDVVSEDDYPDSIYGLSCSQKERLHYYGPNENIIRYEDVYACIPDFPTSKRFTQWQTISRYEPYYMAKACLYISCMRCIYIYRIYILYILYFINKKKYI